MTDKSLNCGTMEGNVCNLNVQWGHFNQHALESRKEMYFTKHYADVALISKDKKKIQAHKSIIGPASVLLKTVFLSQDPKNPTSKIFLNDIMEDELSALLQFIYLGEAVIQEERLAEFKAATKALQIVGLEEPKTVGPPDQPANIINNTNTEEVPLINPLLDRDSKNTMNFLSSERNDETNVNLKMFEPGPPQIKVKKSESIKSVRTLDRNYYSENHTGSIDVINIKKEKSPLMNKTKSSKGVTPRGPRLESDHEIFEVKKDVDGNVARFYKGVNIDVTLDCPECEKTFGNPHSLRDHIRYKHIGIKFDCHLCDYKATKKFSLKFHIQTMHFGMMFPCNYCSYKNGKKPRLEQHILNKHSNMLSSSELEALKSKGLIEKQEKTNKQRTQKTRKLMEIGQSALNMGSVLTNGDAFGREIHSLFTPVGN